MPSMVRKQKKYTGKKTAFIRFLNICEAVLGGKKNLDRQIAFLKDDHFI